MLPNGNFGYGYDAVGNRTSATIGANTYTYVYPGTSNRLSSTTGPVPAKNNSYDGAGNLTADGTNSYLYEARGRLVAATVAGVNSIRQYNGVGERTFRSPQPGISTAYAFDEAGRLIGEYTNDTVNGTLYGVEYLYLEGIVMGIAPFTVPAPGAPAQYAGGSSCIRANAQGDTIYHYDSQGRLIAESTPTGTIQKEYLYLGDIPVAVIQ